MRNMLRLSFVVATLATLTLANSAGAATILIFGQESSADVITERSSGGITTLTTGAGPVATPIPVSITDLGGITPPGGSVLGFETFTLISPSPGSGTSLGNFSGTILFTQTVGGPVVLSAAVTDGLLTLTGNAGTFSTATSTFTYPAGAIQAQVGPAPTFGGSALSFSNVSGTIATGFTAENAGDFATAAVPEPASIVMGSFALLTSLGFFGLRRLKASKA